VTDFGDADADADADADVFLIDGLPGVIYKQQVYKICVVNVPGYKQTEKKEIMFGQPKEDDVLKVHWYIEYKSKIEPKATAEDSDSD
jgi:hypothetical protein